MLRHPRAELEHQTAPLPSARSGAMARHTLRNAYDPGHHLPLGGYITLVTLFGAGLGSALTLASPRRMRLATADLLLFGVATFQVARIISKDKVLGPLRAPFTQFQEPSGAGEIEDAARGEGLQKAVGELLTCPYCLAPWVASAFAIGTLFAPRKTRWLASIFAVVALADICQQGYATLRKTS
jgi:hypothetical protein